VRENRFNKVNEYLVKKAKAQSRTRDPQAQQQQEPQQAPQHATGSSDELWALRG